MEPGLLIILIPVVIITLFYFIPELLRWLSRRNRQQAQQIRQSLEDSGESLRTLAARLRPYRDLSADTFRRHYEPARDRLQKVVDTYQRLNRRLAASAPPDKPFGLWAFMHLLNNPQEIWLGPTAAVRLWQLKREAEALRGDIESAEALIARAEETPGGLVQAARLLREQRLGKLQETLGEEKEAGLKSAEALRARLAQIQRQTDMLLETMQDGSATGLGRMDTLAAELDGLEEAAAALEADAGALRKQRRAVDARLQEVTAAGEAVLNTAGEQPVREGLEPIMKRAESLEKEARSLQRAERFAEAEARAAEALELLQLASQLASAAKRVRALREVAGTSLQAEAIEVVTRRLHTTYRAAYALCEGPAPGNSALPLAEFDGNGAQKGEGAEEGVDAPAAPRGGERHEALEGLKRRVEQLSGEARHIQEAHDQDVSRVAQEAGAATDQLAQAWQTLQQTVTLPSGDPAIAHYRALQQQHSAANGDPLKLQAYTDDAQRMTRDLTTAIDTIRHGFRQLEALRVELPAMLEKAESEAHNWRCLQPLLTEMKASIATLWQLGGSDVHLAEMQATLSEIETLEEQVRAAYAALDGERRRLAVLERRITQTLQTLTLRRSAESAGEANSTPRSNLRTRAEARLSEARNAPTIAEAHDQLQQTLDWIMAPRH